MIAGPQSFSANVPQPSVAASNSREAHKETLFRLGIAECTIGFLSVVSAVVAKAIGPQTGPKSIGPQTGPNLYDSIGLGSISAYEDYSFDINSSDNSEGIWCGVFVIITGVMGVLLKFSQSRGLYVANMVMAILTAIIVFPGILLSGNAAAASSYYVALVVLHSMVTLFCLVSIAVTITHAIFCRNGVRGSMAVVKNALSVPPQGATYVQQQGFSETHAQQPGAVNPQQYSQQLLC